MPELSTIRWSFTGHDVKVHMLSEKVAYSFTCISRTPHEHNIECLWIWHKCTMELDPIRAAAIHYAGWTPTGVAIHDLISVEPLHIEASVYWPSCCGMHGWIRDGKWQDA